MHFSDPKLGKYAVAAFKTGINYTVIPKKSQVNLNTRQKKWEQDVKRQSIVQRSAVFYKPPVQFSIESITDGFLNTTLINDCNKQY